MKPKYIRGSPVSSLDHLMTLDAVYIYGRVWSKAWFQNLQIGWIKQQMLHGRVFAAVRRELNATD